jgi:hypothetical protein
VLDDKLREECTFDDPDFEDIDVFDLMWDPYGSDVRSCSWMIHRTWTSLAGCLARVQAGQWNTESAQALTEDRLRRMGNGQKYDEVWQERMTASGFGTFAGMPRGEQIHEVWEWHDGERVLTVLDRMVLVQAAENPTVGQKPFHIYRPTPLQRQMVGIGELEPIEHLQRELDTIRSQRRMAANLSLGKPTFYDDAAIDPEDVKNFWRPNAAIRSATSTPRTRSGSRTSATCRAPATRRSRSSAPTWTPCRASTTRTASRGRSGRRRRRSWCRPRCRSGSSCSRAASRSRWSGRPRRRSWRSTSG